MAVEATSRIRPLSGLFLPSGPVSLQVVQRQVAPIRLFQGYVNVVHDASGGAAQLTLVFPKDSRALWFLRKFSLWGEATREGTLSVLAQFEVTPGLSWRNQSVGLQIGNVGVGSLTVLKAEAADAACRILSPIWWPEDLLAADTPAINWLTVNSNGAESVMTVLAIRVDRDRWSPELGTLLGL